MANVIIRRNGYSYRVRSILVDREGEILFIDLAPTPSDLGNTAESGHGRDLEFLKTPQYAHVHIGDGQVIPYTVQLFRVGQGTYILECTEPEPSLQESPEVPDENIGPWALPC